MLKSRAAPPPQLARRRHLHASPVVFCRVLPHGRRRAPNSPVAKTPGAVVAAATLRVAPSDKPIEHPCYLGCRFGHRRRERGRGQGAVGHRPPEARPCRAGWCVPWGRGREGERERATELAAQSCCLRHMCHAMPCHAMPCHAMPCATSPYHTTRVPASPRQTHPTQLIQRPSAPASSCSLAAARCAVREGI